MKKNLLLLFFCGLVFAQLHSANQPTIMLSGASFAIPQNGWFELMCQSFNATPINKAVGGEAIYHTANRMADGTFYTADELDRTDVFVIMHVHEQNVLDESVLKADYSEYSFPTDNYSVAYDYVIRKYTDDCRNLKDNPQSKYYGTENGKPAVIVLCTHWHDARPTYNESVRRLAAKWNLPLIKFDEQIGFSNDETVDGQHPSIPYAQDTKTINGITSGWHPRRGSAEYIQRKLAEIATDALEEILGDVEVSATAEVQTPAVSDGDKAYVRFSFKGHSPWNLTYEVDGNTTTVENIDLMQNPLLVEVDVPESGSLTVRPTLVSNPDCNDGACYGQAVIARSEFSILPAKDTYIHESLDKDYETTRSTEVKTSNDKNSRESFFTFNLQDLSDENGDLFFRAYCFKQVYSGNKDIQDIHRIEISAIPENYDTWTWATRPEGFEPIDTVCMYPNDLNRYLYWNITPWVKQQREAGKQWATFRLKVVSGGLAVMSFHSKEATSLRPQIVSLPEKSLPRVTVEAMTPAITAGDKAYVSFSFTGHAPWKMSYEADGTSHTIENIETSPLLVEVSAPETGSITIRPTHVSDAENSEGECIGNAKIACAEFTVLPEKDTYVHETVVKDYETAKTIEVKTSTDKYSREGFLTFNLENLPDGNGDLFFRAYCFKQAYSGNIDRQDLHYIEIGAKPENYDTWTWATRPEGFEPIDTVCMYPYDLNRYLYWNITPWVKQQREAGTKWVTFRLKVVSGGLAVMSFHSKEATSLHPQIIAMPENAPTGISETSGNSFSAPYPNPFSDRICLSGEMPRQVRIYSATGTLAYQSGIMEPVIETSHLAPGIYFVQLLSDNSTACYRMIKRN